MDRVLDDLFHKRGLKREEALSSITNDFNVKCRFQFAGKNFATLLYRCLNSFIKGSSKEIVLASRVLGLLAITVGCGDNAHELYKESLPVISQALKSKNESVLSSMLECLAIVTFVGGNDFEETEASMELIWHFIHSKPGENVVKNHSASVLSGAIYSWSLLLTSVDGWNLSHTHWKGALSFFVDLLEVDDQSVCTAAIEALALICEVGCLEKFSNKDFDTKELQTIISKQAQRLLELQNSTAKTIKHNFSLNILKILEDGLFQETSLKIGKHGLELHSLAQLLQVKFLKSFLGHGFVQHMMENEFLHDVFNFTPTKQNPRDKLYIAEREEIVVHLFVPERRKMAYDDEDLPKIHRSTSSAIRKGKTQLLKKHRKIKGEEISPLHDD